MSRKCIICPCQTCLNTCCARKNCTGKKKECNRHNGFRQMSIFDVQEPEYRKAPRHSWEYYGITKERHKQLIKYIQSGRYAAIASQAAHAAAPDIAEYILLSIKKKLSYEGLERLWQLREIERMACCRTDFYGYRRYFYHLFDLELRRIGK